MRVLRNLEIVRSLHVSGGWRPRIEVPVRSQNYCWKLCSVEPAYGSIDGTLSSHPLQSGIDVTSDSGKSVFSSVPLPGWLHQNRKDLSSQQSQAWAIGVDQFIRDILLHRLHVCIITIFVDKNHRENGVSTHPPMVSSFPCFCCKVWAAPDHQHHLRIATRRGRASRIGSPWLQVITSNLSGS